MPILIYRPAVTTIHRPGAETAPVWSSCAAAGARFSRCSDNGVCFARPSKDTPVADRQGCSLVTLIPLKLPAALAAEGWQGRLLYLFILFFFCTLRSWRMLKPLAPWLSREDQKLIAGGRQLHQRPERPGVIQSALFPGMFSPLYSVLFFLPFFSCSPLPLRPPHLLHLLCPGQSKVRLIFLDFPPRVVGYLCVYACMLGCAHVCVFANACKSAVLSPWTWVKPAEIMDFTSMQNTDPSSHKPCTPHQRQRSTPLPSNRATNATVHPARRTCPSTDCVNDRIMAENHSGHLGQWTTYLMLNDNQMGPLQTTIYSTCETYHKKHWLPCSTGKGQAHFGKPDTGSLSQHKDNACLPLVCEGGPSPRRHPNYPAPHTNPFPTHPHPPQTLAPYPRKYHLPSSIPPPREVQFVSNKCARQVINERARIRNNSITISTSWPRAAASRRDRRGARERNWVH